MPKIPYDLRQNQSSLVVFASVLQALSTRIKYRRILLENLFLFFHFIFSFSSSGFFNSAHETCGRGRSLAFHVIKIIMLRQQTNHKV